MGQSRIVFSAATKHFKKQKNALTQTYTENYNPTIILKFKIKMKAVKKANYKTIQYT